MIKQMRIGPAFAVVDDATANPLVNGAGKVLASCTSQAASDAAYRLISGDHRHWLEKLGGRRIPFPGPMDVVDNPIIVPPMWKPPKP